MPRRCNHVSDITVKENTSPTTVIGGCWVIRHCCSKLKVWEILSKILKTLNLLFR